MLTSRFQDLLVKLMNSFVAYDDVERTPETIAELGDKRWALEGARRAIAVEREIVPSRRVQQRPARKTAVSESDQMTVNVQGMICS